MTQIAQLSESEIEDQFHIVGNRALAFTLDGYVRNGAQFSVNFGDQMYLTRLLQVLPDQGVLIFDCSGSETINRQLLASTRCSFVGRPEGIHVQFMGNDISEAAFMGGRAFSVDLPVRMIRLQRRESFRIETPRVRPLVFYGRLPGNVGLDFSAHDLSVEGVGLNATQLPEGLVVGEKLLRCHFHLPEEAHEVYCNATVRHVTELSSRNGQRQWRVGLQFDGLPAQDQNRIQRYLVRVERERHELL